MPGAFRDAFVDVDGLDLRFLAAGNPEAPMVLFLHGFPEHCGAWRSQLEALADTHYAVAVDLPGCNLSGKPADLRAYRAGPVAAVLARFIERLGHRRCVIVGHDWGGAIGWYLAATRPETVSRFVAVNAVHPLVFARELATSPAQRVASEYFELFQRADAEIEISRDDFSYLWSMFSAPEGGRPEWLDARAEGEYRRCWSVPGALAGGLNYYRASAAVQGATTFENRDRLGGSIPEAKGRSGSLVVSIPTLVIWGEQDRFLTTGNLDGLNGHATKLEIVRVPEATHWIVHERPELVARLVSRFLHDT